jgi:predicted ATPase/tRNA A-37 threonylcarbamoyl transferase component Bud32
MAGGMPPEGLNATLTFAPSAAHFSGADLVSPGDVLDQRFEVRRIIARGGMGVVAEAEDRVLATRVALKFIKPALAGEPAARERFRREILLARRITHRNICRIFELFSSQWAGESILFFTMELLDGETLSERLRSGPLTPAKALPLVEQMVDALEAAHAQGIVHRDFKSSNVMLVPDSPSERVVVTDFGIARALEHEKSREAAMTNEGLLGTPDYMAPEQVLGGRVTPATDIYALGVVLFEMLSGELPFQGATPLATAMARISETAPRLTSRRPGVDATWDAVAATCMAREPVFRYATVRDVLRALQGGLAAPAPRPVLRESLPAEVTPFLGRTREVNAAAALLRRRGVRLVTLTGPGGTGKTRLCIEVARMLADDFTHGVSFVSLSKVSNPERVPHTIAAALELKEVAGTPIEEVVLAFLRPRKQLLVLDNFEHVLPAAPVIARLLRAAPSLSVLVTSRSLLRLSGEHDLPVPGMGVSTLEATSAKEALQNDAVRLFAERAQALSPSFEVTDDNAADVLALCQRLDGLPLAIELAAARIRRDTPRSMLERLSQSGALQVLGQGFHDAERRQQTLRETIAWSDALLLQEERSLFRALGIFASGATLEGAAAVAGIGQDTALELLGSLVDKSLLQRVLSPHLEERFVMLHTLREYAVSELEKAGHLTVSRRRHATYWLSVAERTAPALRGPEQGRLLAELEADHEEMLTALQWLTAEGQRNEALRLCVALAAFWDVRGHWVEGHRLLASALEQAPTAPELLKARALHWLGVLRWCLGTLKESRQAHEEAMAVCRSAGEERLLAEGLYRVGWTALFQGDLAAMQRFTDALAELAERLDDRRLRALARSNLSVLESEIGDPARAIPLADEAIELMREVGDAYAYGFFQNVRGELARLVGDEARARVAYEEELRVGRQLGCKRFLAVSNGNLGSVSANRGDWKDTLQRISIALQINQGLGERRNLPCALLNVAEAVMHLGDPELAAQVMGAADASLERFPMHYSASDRAAIERFRRALGERLPPERLERLRREGARLTLEEAMLRVLAFKS